jgi:hypothetical protein
MSLADLAKARRPIGTIGYHDRHTGARPQMKRIIMQALGESPLSWPRLAGRAVPRAKTANMAQPQVRRRRQSLRLRPPAGLAQAASWSAGPGFGQCDWPGIFRRDRRRGACDTVVPGRANCPAFDKPDPWEPPEDVDQNRADGRHPPSRRDQAPPATPTLSKRRRPSSRRQKR